MKPVDNFNQFASNSEAPDSKIVLEAPDNLQIPQFEFIQEEFDLEDRELQDLTCFQNCFSPKDTAQSLQKRNEGLKMLRFDNSDEDPDEVYNKRKKKVENLRYKEGALLQEIQSIKETDPVKYQAIIDFTKFICMVKQSIPCTRTDYYSNKTFCALKNASESDLNQLTSLLKRMYARSMKVSQNSTNSQSSSCKIEDDFAQKAAEFLIIPRFLISKDKINRLIKDQSLQQNFIFLVINKCLGHYNNEANKKMPKEHHMEVVRNLLRKADGREKFKRICSINHGSRLLKNQSPYYYELYNKSLEYLKYLQLELKKGKKIQTIKKKLQGMQFQKSQKASFSSYNENDSSSVFSFGSFKDELIKIQKDPQDNIEQQLIDSEPVQIQNFSGMKKKHVKKLMSMPLEYQNKEKKFGVKKSLTMQQKKTPTIILVKPPSQI